MLDMDEKLLINLHTKNAESRVYISSNKDIESEEHLLYPRNKNIASKKQKPIFLGNKNIASNE
jgi:hypothetical protein